MHRLLASLCVVSATSACFVGEALCLANPVALGCDSSERQVETCEGATRPCREAVDCDASVVTLCEELPVCADVDDLEPCYDDGSTGSSSD